MAPFNYPGYGGLPSVHERLNDFLETAKAPARFERSTDTVINIMALPAEMIGHVFEYVPNKHDLAQVCMANKRFFATAMPILYRELRLTVSEVVDPSLAQLFNGTNVGLKSIRALHITTPSMMSLPAAGRVHLDLPHTLPGSVYKIMWQRQLAIEHLDILPTHHPLQSRAGTQDRVDLHAELKKSLRPSLKSVRVVPNVPRTATLGCAALQLGIVTGLEVDARLWRDPRPAQDLDDDEDEDGDGVDGVLSQPSLAGYLFDHLGKAKPGSTPACDQFTTLTLKDVDLSGCKRTWCTYLNLQQLKHLSLEYCKGTDVFLTIIVPGATPPPLESLTVVQTIRQRYDRTLRAVEEILKSPTSTLKTLILCLRNAPKLPRPSSICAHSKTLQQLLLDVSTNTSAASTLYYPTYGHDGFHSIVTECTSLRELGIALPGYQLEYKDFSTESSLRQPIDLIISNLQLSLLNILNWPNQYRVHGQPGYHASTAPQLARIAAGIFSRFRHYDRRNSTFVRSEILGGLEAVVFGIIERNCNVPKPIYFVPCEVAVMSRPKMWHAQDVTLEYLRSQRLDSVIING